MKIAVVVIALSVSITSAKADKVSPDAKAAQDARFAVYEPAVRNLPRCSTSDVCPAGVDPDYVLTPSGWFHPSCIVPISNDEIFDHETLLVENIDGTTRAVSDCAFDARDKSGAPIAFGAKPPSPSSNTWLSAVMSNPGAVTLVDAYWTVPKAPVSSGGVVYMFPGVRKATAGIIFQPVLGYNADTGLGGTTTGWTINSWDCCTSGGLNIMGTSPVAVSEGATIHGYVAGANCSPATGVCGAWTVSISDGTHIVSGTYNANTLAFGTGGGGDVLGSVLEVYTPSTCPQLPASLGDTFTNVEVWDMTFARMPAANVGWYTYYPGSPNPDCKVSTTISNSGANSTQATVWWPSVAPQRPSFPSGCGWLSAGQGLLPGQSVYSCDGRFRLTLSASNGGAYLYQGGTLLWSNTTFFQLGHPADALVMQSDGNLVRYSPTAAKWASNTAGYPYNVLAIQNDGNLVVYSYYGTVMWSSNTCCH